MPRQIKEKGNNKYFEAIASFKPLNAEESNKILSLVENLEKAMIERKSHYKNWTNTGNKIKDLLETLIELKNKNSKYLRNKT